MKKVGILLLIIGIAIIGFYYVYLKTLESKENNNIDEFIQETSIIEEGTEDVPPEVIEEKTESKSNTINYTAVLEIPVINLKRGVVDSTKNFKSINYAISVDKSSNYPNEFGSFILYAHSGNSSVAYFKNLTKVSVSDDVYVYFNGVKYHYVIYDKYDIKKNGKTVINRPTYDKNITLITCNQNRKGFQTVLVGKIVDSSVY